MVREVNSLLAMYDTHCWHKTLGILKREGNIQNMKVTKEKTRMQNNRVRNILFMIGGLFNYYLISYQEFRKLQRIFSNQILVGFSLAP